MPGNLQITGQSDIDGVSTEIDIALHMRFCCYARMLRETWPRWGMIVGVLLSIVPFFGVVNGRIRTMEALADSDLIDDKGVANVIGAQQWFVGLAAVLGIAGAILFIVSVAVFYLRALDRKRKQRKADRERSHVA